eukprot:402176-Rhodomonas_salina.2
MPNQESGSTSSSDQSAAHTLSSCSDFKWQYLQLFPDSATLLLDAVLLPDFAILFLDVDRWDVCNPRGHWYRQMYVQTLRPVDYHCPQHVRPGEKGRSFRRSGGLARGLQSWGTEALVLTRAHHDPRATCPEIVDACHRVCFQHRGSATGGGEGAKPEGRILEEKEGGREEDARGRKMH